MAVEPICELAGVSKSFAGRRVVDNLNLRVGAGELVALTGPSGCGKSTVLNMIGLLEPRTSGSIMLFGKPAPRVGSGAARALLRSRLGYLFQNFALIDTDTAAENLAVAQSRGSASRAERASARAAVLARVGIAGVEKRKTFTLSGGEQQRLSVARLMLKPCDLVLADEPTGSLDAQNRDAVLALLRGMRDSGKTIIIVTHDPAVSAACDRVISLTPA